MVKENINNSTLKLREICKSESFLCRLFEETFENAQKIKMNATSVTLHPLWHVNLMRHLKIHRRKLKQVHPKAGGCESETNATECVNLMDWVNLMNLMNFVNWLNKVNWRNWMYWVNWMNWGNYMRWMN